MLIYASQLIYMDITDRVKLMQSGAEYKSELKKKNMLSSARDNIQLP